MRRHRPQIFLEDFAETYSAASREFADCLIDQLTDSRMIEPSATGALRSEVCAAVWVAMQAVLDSAPLTDAERGELRLVLARHMTPFWRKHCVDDQHVAELMAYRPADSGHATSEADIHASAARIVGELLANTRVSRDAESLTVEGLETELANRMFVDLRRLDEFRKTASISQPSCNRPERQHQG